MPADIQPDPTPADAPADIGPEPTSTKAEPGRKRADVELLAGVAERHGGLVTISEILDCGFSRSWASARVESELWQRLHRRVYATFPNEPTWEQWAHAAVLVAGTRAALARSSAAYLHKLQTEQPRVIEIVLPHTTRVGPAKGVLIHRTRRAFAMVGNPHRTTLLDTVIDLVDIADGHNAVLSLLTGGVRLGLKPQAILAGASRRRYLGNRATLRAILAADTDGAESPLEYQFLTNVVRAHGLPAPVRQARMRVRGYWIRSDCWYEAYRVRVELDGEIAHPGKASDRDILRDNDVLLTLGEITLRLRWVHTLSGACVSAAQLAVGLQRGGFEGEPRACGPACTAPAEFRKLLATTPPSGR